VSGSTEIWDEWVVAIPTESGSRLSNASRRSLKSHPADKHATGPTKPHKTYPQSQTHAPAIPSSPPPKLPSLRIIQLILIHPGRAHKSIFLTRRLEIDQMPVLFIVLIQELIHRTRAVDPQPFQKSAEKFARTVARQSADDPRPGA
jgi:hypothetical protein